MENDNIVTKKIDFYDSEIDTSNIDVEVEEYLNDVEEEIVPVTILTGTIPTIKGDNNNLINTLLTLKDLNLTNIGNAFYKSEYCVGRPLDKLSKSVYASVFNQLVVINIVNTIWSDLQYVPQGLYYLDFEETPKYLDERLLVNAVSYVLRLKGINAIVMDTHVYCQRTNNNLCVSDRVASTFNYLKDIVKSNIDCDMVKYYIKVHKILDELSVRIFNYKCNPTINSMYCLDSCSTDLSVLSDTYEEMLIEVKEGTLTIESVYDLAFKVAKLRAELLVSLGKLDACIEDIVSLSALIKLSSDKFYSKNKQAFCWLEDNSFRGDVLTEDDKAEMEVIFTSSVKHMFKDIENLIEKYKQFYLGLNLDLSSEEELEAIETSDLG